MRILTTEQDINFLVIDMNYDHTLLRRKQVEEMTTLSRSTIYDLMKKGHFPKSIAISPKTIVWRKIDIEQWIREQFEALSHF